MSLTIICAPHSGSGTTVTYAALSGTSNGKYALDCNPGATQDQIMRFRVPGVLGHYVVRGGEIGHTVEIRVRYVAASLSDLRSAIETDLGLFRAAAYNIASDGLTCHGCNIDGPRCRFDLIKPTGRTADQVFRDLTLVFIEDQPT